MSDIAPSPHIETNLGPIGEFVLVFLLTVGSALMALGAIYVPVSKYLIISEQPIMNVL